MRLFLSQHFDENIFSLEKALVTKAGGHRHMATSWPPCLRKPMSSVSGPGDHGHWSITSQGDKSSEVPLRAPSCASLNVGASSLFQGWRAFAHEAYENATDLNLSHVTAVLLWAMQLVLLASLPDVDFQRTHLALEIFIWPLWEGVASKNIHTVGQQKEWEQCASLGCIPSSVEKHVY